MDVDDGGAGRGHGVERRKLVKEPVAPLILGIDRMERGNQEVDVEHQRVAGREGSDALDARTTTLPSSSPIVTRPRPPFPQEVGRLSGFWR